jgi:aryl-alcohol dehydrogenase-like predicted oxidoreductase
MSERKQGRVEMDDLPRATLGRTGLEVTQLGYGAMELRGGQSPLREALPPDVARDVLNAVLDAGINYIDTSPDYGASEEFIGEHISGRRDEFFLASKCGCPVGEVPPREQQSFAQAHVFTRANVRAGVEQSLRRMKTDHLDVVQFHASPPRSTLEENDSVAELLELRDEGKIRFIGMSGTNPHLADHIRMGVFDVFQIPYSAVEPEHYQLISDAAASGAGTVIRGGVARGFPKPPAELPEQFRTLLQQRSDRWESAVLDDLLGEMSRMEFMLRFTLSHPNLSTTIVGTSSLNHLAANLEAARKGPLPPDVYETAKHRFSAI